MNPLFSDQVRRDPYPLYARMRETSPVCNDPASGLWMVFDFEGVQRVLSDHETFSSRHGPDWMIFHDPPRHTKLRALVSRAFTPRSVAALEGRIAQISSALLDGVMDRGEMDVATDFAGPLPTMVIAEMLGIPPDDRDRYDRWSRVIIDMAQTVVHTPAANAALEAFISATTEMDRYLRDVLARRRAEPRDDLLTRLALAEVDGERLTSDEILGFFQLLLVAGQETTTNLIGNAVLTFTEHPTELAKLRATPALLPAAIEEVLRYRSPLQWIYRKVARDVELHGQTVPKGRLILAMIGSANRDPARFAAPNVFNMDREPNEHIAFGVGRHFCLGAPLARLEARVALGDFLSRFGSFEMTGPWEPRKGLHVLGPARLPIRFSTRR